MRYQNGSFPKRVKAYMLGFYTAKQEANTALSDIPFSSLSTEYVAELAEKANKATLHMKRTNLSTPTLKKDKGC